FRLALAEHGLSILVRPGMQAFRVLAAAPEIAVLSPSPPQQLSAGCAAPGLGGHAIIVVEACLATFVKTGAVPVVPPTVFGAHHGTGAHRAAEAFVGGAGGLAILVEQRGLALGKSRADPEGAHLADDAAHGFATLRTAVLSPWWRGGRRD